MMSEEKPRLSRREMRERGLLKPADANAPEEGVRQLLTETQELRLGRPSRQQLREQEKRARRQHAVAQATSSPGAVGTPASAGTPAAEEQTAEPAHDVAITPDSAASSDIAAEPELEGLSAAHIEAVSAPTRTGTAPSASSADTSAAAGTDVSGQNERKSVFDRFDDAPLISDDARASRDTNGEAAVKNKAAESADGATLEDKFLARVRNDVGASWPGPSSPTGEASALTRRFAEPAQAGEAHSVPPRSEPVPTRTPIAERDFLDADEEEEVVDEKPRGGLMLVFGIIAGAVLGVLIGMWLKNTFFSSGVVDVQTVRAAAAIANPSAFFQGMHL
jgi:hypothetical protein